MWILLLLNCGYTILLMLFARKFLAGRRLVKELPADVPEISVVVPFRNEELRLPDVLASLKAQHYPAGKTEWIFVDDHSEDGSASMVTAEKELRIKLVSLPHGETGKKQALTKGIREATGTWIITTDADCVHDPNWVKILAGTAGHDDIKMACGMVKVQQDGSALAAFQAMETAVLQTSGAGSLLLGQPLLNTGASLCFRRDAWETLGGYSEDKHIASGDDTFQLLRFYQRFKRKVVPVVHPAATPATLPAARFSEMLAQRIRWNGKVKYYPLSSIHLTGLLVVGASIAWLLSVVTTVAGVTGILWPVGILLLRLIGEGMVLAAWKTVVGQSFSLVQILLMSVFYPVFTILSFIIRPFLKIEWKGRRV